MTELDDLDREILNRIQVDVPLANRPFQVLAPDYSWWHGFYDCKERYTDFMEYARDDLLKHNKKTYRSPDYPNATGNKNKPPEVLPRTR